MPAAPELATLAYHAERAAARRLAARSGFTFEQALVQTLHAVAGGAAGLDALLARRAAEQLAHALKAAERAQRSAAVQAHRAALKNAALTPWRGWFDGSACPNPGRCGIGALLTGPDGLRIAVARAAGYGNSSEAEYRALILLLETALQHGAEELTVYGDSKVVIDDLTGAVLPPAASLAIPRAAAQALLARLPQATLRWIPRHRNSEADALSQQARSIASEPDTQA